MTLFAQCNVPKLSDEIANAAWIMKSMWLFLDIMQKDSESMKFDLNWLNHLSSVEVLQNILLWNTSIILWKSFGEKILVPRFFVGKILWEDLRPNGLNLRKYYLQ